MGKDERKIERMKGSQQLTFLTNKLDCTRVLVVGGDANNG
jgi:hypothetical protein